MLGGYIVVDITFGYCVGILSLSYISASGFWVNRNSRNLLTWSKIEVPMPYTTFWS
jgi:hypothetical protein